MDRRTFLKTAGLGSLTLAAGCNADPENHLFSLVNAPDDMVTGQARWYASTCRECPAGCGILAKNREGRVIKIEGNPLHPVSAGSVCMRGQAALQGIYNPDRLRTPLVRDGAGWKPLTFPEAFQMLADRAQTAARQGPGGVKFLTETVGDSQLALMQSVLQRWDSPPPLVFEPYGYEALKQANETVFGTRGLPSYRIEQADVLVSFGADFLETWLSPVEYARRFKAMHTWQSGAKGVFLDVGPYQSLTAANADRWFGCRPGGQSFIVAGLIRAALERGRGRALSGPLQQALRAATENYDVERVAQTAGLEAEAFHTLTSRVVAARRPLILGAGNATDGRRSLETDVAVNLLNRILDPPLERLDFARRHRVETAADRATLRSFIADLDPDRAGVLLLNNVNPVFNLPEGHGLEKKLSRRRIFTVAFSAFTDETTRLADLIFPPALALESWDEYAGHSGIVSMLQPAMGRLTPAPQLGDVLLALARGPDAGGYRRYLFDRLQEAGRVSDDAAWVQTVRQGGIFPPDKSPASGPPAEPSPGAVDVLAKLTPPATEPVLLAAPSLRFFDGRGANRPWLCEVPDPLTKVAWQTPAEAHPSTLAAAGVRPGDVVRIETPAGRLTAPAYDSEGVHPGVWAVKIGQGHRGYGRYARDAGADPLALMPAEDEGLWPQMVAAGVAVRNTGRRMALAHTDGSRFQHGRKIALSVAPETLQSDPEPVPAGLGMNDFPLTLPLPEGYDPHRDFYPPHAHDTYRWGMVVDLDRCTGCGACAVACYAENNIGVVGVERILEGREMSWLRVERYQDRTHRQRVTFIPMMCQHCDNAPCESVCPVYAPHHSKEGLNNQIYNRCIGTRFCVQNCPYKVRRFNWFDWQWPEPLPMQLNPNVTVRSKGVMEKCSFCVQRIKEAHDRAKNEKRTIRDGEVTPACVQTCPTGALTFGNLMDTASRVRQLAGDRRAYQVMGYLNTKPAVIYLKKVRVEI